jgi:DNA-binding NtrC family response regulator
MSTSVTSRKADDIRDRVMVQSKNEASILIVDDEVGVRDSMQEFIEMAGFKPAIASSAEEAIELIQSNSIQVVITDIMLPEMGGLELTRLIKKEYDADVIVMTGYSGDYSYEEAKILLRKESE